MATTPSEATYQRLLSALESRIHKSRLITDDVRRLAYGTDASFYRLIPKLVVQAESLMKSFISSLHVVNCWCRLPSVPRVPAFRPGSLRFCVDHSDRRLAQP